MKKSNMTVNQLIIQEAILAFAAPTALVVIPRSPELLIERSRRSQDVKA